MYFIQISIDHQTKKSKKDTLMTEFNNINEFFEGNVTERELDRFFSNQPK